MIKILSSVIKNFSMLYPNTFIIHLCKRFSKVSWLVIQNCLSQNSTNGDPLVRCWAGGGGGGLESQRGWGVCPPSPAHAPSVLKPLLAENEVIPLTRPKMAFRFNFEHYTMFA